jgi:hypothetical protein
VNKSSVVDHGIDTVGEIIPHILGKTELGISEVTTQGLESGSPCLIPEAVCAASRAKTLESLFLSLGTNESNDLGGRLLTGKKVTEDVGT